MSRAKINVFTEKDNKFKRRTYTDINPAKSDADILDFAENLNSLTDNNLGEVYKVQDNVETDLTPITSTHIKAILQGSFTPFPDSDSISAADINNIL